MATKFLFNNPTTFKPEGQLSNNLTSSSTLKKTCNFTSGRFEKVCNLLLRINGHMAV